MKNCVSKVGPLVAMAFVVACMAIEPMDDATAANEIVTAGNHASSGISSGAARAGASQASGNGTDSNGTTLTGGDIQATIADGGVPLAPLASRCVDWRAKRFLGNRHQLEPEHGSRFGRYGNFQ